MSEQTNPPLFAEHASKHAGVPPFRKQTTAAVHVKLDRLPISVIHVDGAIDIRADWKRLKWDRYVTIGEAIRKIVAVHVELDPEAVSVVCSLYVMGDCATARLSIDLPASHQPRLASPKVQQAIGHFMRQLKSGGTHSPATEAAVPRSPSTDDMWADDDSEQSSRLAVEVHNIGREVRAVLGGCALSVPCVVESPAWDETFEVVGKLAPKPRNETPKPNVIEHEYRLDGFRPSKHAVYLAPLDSPLDVREVVYCEETWHRLVVECASLEPPVCRAVIEEVGIGSKAKRTLLALSRVAGV